MITKIEVVQTLIQQLERGKQSAHQLRTIVHQNLQSNGRDSPSPPPQPDLHYKMFDDHSKEIISVLESVHSALSTPDFLHFPKSPKSEHPDDDFDQPIPSKDVKDRRGTYKRRRIGQPVVQVMNELTEDGYAWRKYGQKSILNTNHPRNYYRCTHKTDQGCLATKQIQQITENPTTYRVTYHGKHSCNTNLNLNPTILFASPPSQDSSILWNFEAKDPNPNPNPNPDLNPNPNPFVFSSSPSSSSSSSPFSTAVMKQEYGSMNEKMGQSGPSDLHQHQNQNSPSNDYLSPCSGLRSAPVSEQGNMMSSAEDYSCTEVDYSNLMEYPPFDFEAVMSYDAQILRIGAEFSSELVQNMCPSRIRAI